MANLNGERKQGVRGGTTLGRARGRVELRTMARASQGVAVGVETDRATEMGTRGVERPKGPVVQTKDEDGAVAMEGEVGLFLGQCVVFTDSHDSWGLGVGGRIGR
jgi:hypothetical protein